MPIIKRWTPKVEEAPLPNVQVVPANWVGAQNVARSMEVVTQTLSTMENKAQEDEARSILAGASAQLGDYRLQLESELDKVKGEDALKKDILTDHATRFAERAGEIRSSLPPAAQAHFDSEYASQSVGFHRAIQGHIAKEADAYSQVQHKAELSNAANIAARSAVATVMSGGAVTSNPDLDAQRERVVREADRIAARNGWKGEAADSAKRLNLTQYHLGVAEAIVGSEAEGKAGAAKAYLAKYSNEIDAKALADSKVESQINAATLADKARAEETRIWTETGGDPGKALEAVRAIKDTPLADAVDARLKKRIGEDTEVRRAADSPLIGKLSAAIDQGKGLDQGSADFGRLSWEGKAVVLAKWDAHKRSSKSEASQERIVQNQIDAAARDHFVGAIPIAGAPGADQISIDVDTHPDFKDVSQPGRDRIKKLQRDIQAAHRKDQGVALGAVEAQAKELAKSLGYSDNRTTNFIVAVRSAYGLWQGDEKNKGKEQPTRADVYGMLKEALGYGDEKGGSMFASNRYAWEAKQKGAGHTTKGFENEQPGWKALDELYAQEKGGVPAAPSGPPMDMKEAARVQAAWAASPEGKGRPPLTEAQVRRYLEAEKAKGAK